MPVSVSSENDWTETKTPDKYNAGSKIERTFEVQDVTGYTKELTVSESGDTITVTAAYTLETIDVSYKTLWLGGEHDEKLYASVAASTEKGSYVFDGGEAKAVPKYISNKPAERKVTAEDVKGFKTAVVHLLPNVSVDLSGVATSLGFGNMASLLTNISVEDILDYVEAGKVAGYTLTDDMKLQIVETVIDLAAGKKTDSYIALVVYESSVVNTTMDVITIWNDNNDKEGARPGSITFNDGEVSMSGTYAGRGNIWYSSDVLTIVRNDEEGNLVDHTQTLEVDRPLDGYYVNDYAFPVVIFADENGNIVIPDVEVSEVQAALEKLNNKLATLTAEDVIVLLQAVLGKQVPDTDMTVQELMEKIADKMTEESLRELLSDLEAQIDLSEIEAKLESGLTIAYMKWITVNLNTYAGEKSAVVEAFTIWNDYDYEDNRPSSVAISNIPSTDGNHASVTVTGKGYIWGSSTSDTVKYVDIDTLITANAPIVVSFAGDSNYRKDVITFPVVLAEGENVLINASELNSFLQEVQDHLKDGVSDAEWNALKAKIQDYVNVPSTDSLQSVLSDMAEKLEGASMTDMLKGLAGLSAAAVEKIESLPTQDVRLVVINVNTYTGEREVDVDIVKIWNDNSDAVGIRPESISFTFNNTDTLTMNENDHSGNVWYKAGAFTATYGTLTAIDDLSALTMTEEEIADYSASEVVMVPMLVPAAGTTDLEDIPVEVPGDALEDLEDIIDSVENPDVKAELKAALEAAREKLQNNATLENLVNVTADLLSIAKDQINKEAVIDWLKAVLEVNKADIEAVLSELESMDAATLAGAVAAALQVDTEKLEELTADWSAEAKELLNKLMNAVDPRLEDLQALLDELSEEQLDAFSAMLEEKLQNFDFTDVEFKMVAFVVNTFDPDPVDIKVSKVWVDGDDENGLRPASVQAQLYADGTAAGDPVVLVNNEYVWTDLPRFSNDAEIVYTVAEASVSEHYNSAVTGSAENGFVITNTLKENLLTVSKNWVGKTGSSVKIDILRGDEVLESVTLSADNDWCETVTVYGSVNDDISVEEVGVPANYRVSYSSVTGSAGEYSVTVTNTYKAPYIPTDDEEEVETVIVKKMWIGDDESVRPSSIKVKLYRNGKAYDTVTLKENNLFYKNWRYTWKELDDAKWTIKEINVPDGYTCTIEEVSDNYFVITNSYEGETNRNTGAV